VTTALAPSSESRRFHGVFSRRPADHVGTYLVDGWRVELWKSESAWTGDVFADIPAGIVFATDAPGMERAREAIARLVDEGLTRTDGDGA
jgi:hypothetical protein